MVGRNFYMSKRRDLLEEERRAQIIAAARKRFSEKGFHGTSMRSIFEEANLSSGSFYNYFASKTEVVREVCSQDQQALVSQLEKMGNSENPIEAIGRLQQNILLYCYSTDARMWVELYAEACRDSPGLRPIPGETGLWGRCARGRPHPLHPCEVTKVARTSF